ncbi:MAG: arginase [Flavobacteriaceae bacterium]|nr:arginase [Flavobacteriaceae bacterium]
MKNLKIIKNRSDIGAGTRGSDIGIDALEIAAINSNNDFFNHYPFVDVVTHNESIYNKVKQNFAKRINYVVEQCERLSEVTLRELKNNFFPLIISGDHSSSIGTIAGICSAFPKKNLGVIWIDAHADLHSPYTSPSGNVHGMAVAAAMNLDNIKNSSNRVDEKTLKSWKNLKNINNSITKISPSNFIYFGLRSYEDSEKKIIQENKINCYSVDGIRQRGIDVCVNEALKQLDNVEIIYISFDVDSLDCDLISKGTGTPVSKGFDSDEIIKILKNLILSGKVISLEISEINPLLDNRGNKMAETVFKIIDSLF